MTAKIFSACHARMLLMLIQIVQRGLNDCPTCNGEAKYCQAIAHSWAETWAIEKVRHLRTTAKGRTNKCLTREEKSPDKGSNEPVTLTCKDRRAWQVTNLSHTGYINVYTPLT